MTTNKMTQTELTAEDLTTIVGGGWNHKLILGGLCIAAGPIGCLALYQGYTDAAEGK